MEVETEQDAIAVVAAASGPLPEGHRILARRVGGSSIWSVNAVDDRGRGYIGVNQLVGPDGRIWRFSSNPAVHDYQIVKSVLYRLYQSGAAGEVDQHAVARRVEAITRAQEAAVQQLADDALAGTL